MSQQYDDALIIGADNPIELAHLKDRWVEGEPYIDDATVTFTLKSGSYAGSTVASGTLTSINEDGTYRGVVEDNTSLTDGEMYYEEITVDAGNDKIAKFRSKRRARY